MPLPENNITLFYWSAPQGSPFCFIGNMMHFPIKGRMPSKLHLLGIYYEKVINKSIT